ncbi:hypothetical protein FA95DRAFT_1608397 [Auriscalpium vulgare]|uniref:Uncharacterized protein n=1 Tax=Auriscalpium vulgare TaxID=40419 RepID=A0ACB8RLY2_9AGAM|nr:hypothetical protein FA95DRAFT_1608397 [Auriscalpium vulgare]
MIKKRTRPQQRVREIARDTDDDPATPATSTPRDSDSDEANLPVAELLELRRMRKAREGIDVTKLNKGDAKKRRRKQAEAEAAAAAAEEQEYGLRPGAKTAEEEEEDEEAERAAKARRAVRTNNFTQQTNALDVDKHMMAYIEENMKLRRGRPDAESGDSPSAEGKPDDELSKLSEKYKVEKRTAEEGSVTNSLAMLTAIPEVDLGMDARLKNIEETEKAKLILNQERKERKRAGPDDDSEAHLAASRFYRPNLRAKSDADIIRDAKLEALGLPPQDDAHERDRPRDGRSQMATDEAVMERFKKRMRK